MNLRFEAKRYWPKGQRLLTAIQWAAIFGGFQRELAPAGALLVTARELVLISEEKRSPRQLTGDVHECRDHYFLPTGPTGRLSRESS
jgi:hypothetical protein